MWRALMLENGRQALLLNYPAKDEERSADEVNRNLVCIDNEEIVHWQVVAPPPFQPSGDPFVHIALEGSKLVATRFFGDVCEVDQASGNAVIIGWTK
jgi:hypothetical protein